MEKNQKLSPVFQAVANAAAKDQRFTNFDLGLTQETVVDIQALKVTRQTEYDNFGHFDVLRDELARFFEEQGNSPDHAARAADTIEKVVKDSLAAVNAESGWLTMRAFLPTDQYDIPRWHADGRFFDGNEKKIAIALKGAGTLLNDMPDTQRDPFYKLLRSSGEDTAEKRRTIEKLIDPSNTQIPKPGQATIFCVGAEDIAAVHSEPPIHSERIFLSLVPGTAAQVAELRKRWESPMLTTYTPAPQMK